MGGMISIALSIVAVILALAVFVVAIGWARGQGKPRR